MIVAAAAALPLLALAGITLLIMTDRGQLVIESEAADLEVSIEQGDEVVEQLQLSTGENRITLRSGSYTVTMDAEADGLQLSDQQATITRGDETVLRVRREPVSGETAIADGNEAGPRYRGETFGHWKAVLENERDVETVLEAMKAVVALSGEEEASDEGDSIADDHQQSEAAASMLRAARRYGGMAHASLGMTFGGQSSPPSSRFMGHLLARYPALLPNPGLDQISNELAVGNEESSMAAIYLLYNYVGEPMLDELYQPDFGELERWSETAEGRAKLRELVDHVDRAVERLGGYESTIPVGEFRNSEARPGPAAPAAAISLAYKTRLRLNQLLDVDSFDDPAIADQLRRSIENAEKYSRQLFEQVDQPRSGAAPSDQPQPLSKWELTAAVAEMEPDVVTWAVVPSLLQSYFSNPQTPLDLLRRLGEEAPNATADAVLAVFHQRGVSILPAGTLGSGGIGGGSTDPGIPIHPGNEQLIGHAIELVGHFTTKPEPALAVFQKMHEQFETTNNDPAPLADMRKALESAIKQLETRVEQ